MKKTIMVMAAVIMLTAANAQENRATAKTISVNGSAQIEVVPDEIYVQVDLREYTRKNGDKIDINSIKNNFLAACKAMGLTDKDVTVQSYQGYDNNYWANRKNKKQNPDLKASISYWVKVDNINKLDALVDKLDDEATQNFFIAKATYSKMDELRKEMKIAAVKAAKEKAIYLSQAIGEQLAGAITINEPVEMNNYPQPMYANTMMKVAFDNATPALDVDFKKIKIQFDVNVVFGLQ
jgi:uncharacterized protein